MLNNIKEKKQKLNIFITLFKKIKTYEKKVMRTYKPQFRRIDI